jgi:Retinal pigment epithelial membrane protein
MTTAAPVRETENPYLSGNYAPVREEITAVDLDVTGTIPTYLDGRYLRIGPNPLADPDPAKYHWFLGTGMAHGLRLRDGKAHWYRNRYVRSAEVARALGEPGPAVHTPAGSTLRPTPTLSAMPARHWPSPKPGCGRTSSQTNWKPLARRTSAEHYSVDTPHIRSATPRPASYTRSPITRCAATSFATR